MARQVHSESPLEVGLKGAAAGLVGTLALTLALQAVPQLFPDLARVQAPRPEDTEGEAGAPTERLVEKVATGVFETELSPSTRQTLGLGIHWAYGALWGLAYGLMQASLKLPTLLHAPLLGFIVWMFGPMGLVPAMKLAARPTAVPLSRRLVSVGLHQLYGWTVAGTFRLISHEG